MSDDQVTIDPAFRPTPPRTGWSGWIRFGALAAAAFLMGWLLRSPTSGESEATETTTSTVASTREPTSTTRPPEATVTTTVSAVGELEVPLGEAVPGFTDVITMAVSGGMWGEEVEVLRWRSSQPAPETILSFPVDSPNGGEEFVGLDAAGTWYATQDDSDVLRVGPVAAITEALDWWEPTREAVGLRVVSAAWHDTAPGQLAWLSCPRAPDGPGSLFTLDVANGSVDAASVAVSGACGNSDMWLTRWGDWGFAFERAGDTAGQDGWEEVPDWTVLLDPDGFELAQFEQGPGGIYMVAVGPAGTVWNQEPMDGAPSSFLLSLDAQQRTMVPGIAQGEWVDQAQWSPDGSLVAVVTTAGQQSVRVLDTASGETVAEMAANHSLRVVDAATGEIVAAVDELGPVVFQTCWSSDGQYLLVGHDRDDEGAAGTALVVYEVESAAIAVERPVREAHYFREIRTFEPSSVAVQFTPVEWRIGLDEEWGPNVYTVSMSAHASPVLLDQIEGVYGRLIWEETIVDLCNIGFYPIGGDLVDIGDTYQTIEGCGANPTAMQDAFDEFGLPKSACLGVTTGGADHEYCAPLRVDEIP